MDEQMNANESSDEDNDNQMMVEAPSLSQSPPIPAQLKPSTSEQSRLGDSHRDTPSTSGITQRHAKHEHIKQEHIPDNEDNVRISPFSEIDKNEEIPSSLEYKSTSNFSHGTKSKWL